MCGISAHEALLLLLYFSRPWYTRCDLRLRLSAQFVLHRFDDQVSCGYLEPLVEREYSPPTPSATITNWLSPYFTSIRTPSPESTLTMPLQIRTVLSQ